MVMMLQQLPLALIITTLTVLVIIIITGTAAGPGQVLQGTWTSTALLDVIDAVPGVAVIQTPTGNRAVQTGAVLACGAQCARVQRCIAFCLHAGQSNDGVCYLGVSVHPASDAAYPVNSHLPSESESVCYETWCPIRMGYAMYSGRCLRLNTKGKTFYEAETECANEGGHLYDVKSNADVSPVSDVMIDAGYPRSFGIWLGAKGVITRGFNWSDGTPLALDSPLWRPPNPDNADNPYGTGIGVRIFEAN